MNNLSSFELNMAIAEALGVKIPTGEQIKTNNFLKRRGDMLFRAGDGGTYETAIFLDYCNDWSDLMPLVIEHKIHCEWSLLREIWCARGWAGSSFREFSSNDNSQRALAECLLKVLEAK